MTTSNNMTITGYDGPLPLDCTPVLVNTLTGTAERKARILVAQFGLLEVRSFLRFMDWAREHADHGRFRYLVFEDHGETWCYPDSEALGDPETWGFGNGFMKIIGGLPTDVPEVEMEKIHLFFGPESMHWMAYDGTEWLESMNVMRHEMEKLRDEYLALKQ